MNALALRLLAYVLLAGAAIAVAMAFAMTRLAQVTRKGATLYVLPGTEGHGFINPTAVTVLAGAGLTMMVLGLVGVLLTRSPAAAKRRLVPSAAPAGVRRNRRALAILVIGCATLAGVLGLRWGRPTPAPVSPLPALEAPRP